jgi:hypothetical protein
MCKFVFVDARSCLFQEASSTTATSRRVPAGQAPRMGEFEGDSMVLIARAGKVKYSGEAEAQKVVAPFVCTRQYGGLLS